MAFLPKIKLSNIVISLLLLVIAGLLAHSSFAQSRVLCFNESDAINIYNPSPTPTSSLTSTPTPSFTLIPTNTVRPTATTVKFNSLTPSYTPTITLTPFPTTIAGVATQFDLRQQTYTLVFPTNELFAAATNFAWLQTQTPGYNANTAIAQTMLAFPTATQEALYVSFTVITNAGVKTRNCGPNAFNVNCAVNTQDNWLKTGQSYTVDVSQAWCATGTLSGITYQFVLTNLGWAAWRSTNGQYVYLRPNIQLICTS